MTKEEAREIVQKRCACKDRIFATRYCEDNNGIDCELHVSDKEADEARVLLYDTRTYSNEAGLTVKDLIEVLEMIDDKSLKVSVRNCDGYDVAKEVYFDSNSTITIDS